MANKSERHRLSLIMATLGPSTDDEKEFYEENKIEIKRLMSDYIDDKFPIENDFYDE